MLTVLLLIAGQIDPTHAEGVREVIPGERHIIHIRDWHFVPRDGFAIDTELEGEELDEAHAAHLKRVKRIQAVERKILKGVKEVYLEGLTAKDELIFEAMLRVQKKYPVPETALRIGAAGQLIMKGKLKVHPAEGDD